MRWWNRKIKSKKRTVYTTPSTLGEFTGRRRTHNVAFPFHKPMASLWNKWRVEMAGSVPDRCPKRRPMLEMVRAASLLQPPRVSTTRVDAVRRTASSSWTCYRSKWQDKMVASTGLGVVTAQNPTITTVRYVIRQYCKAIESPGSDNARALVNKPWQMNKRLTTCTVCSEILYYGNDVRVNEIVNIP